MRRIRFDEIPWTSTHPGMRSKTFTSKGQRIRILELERGFTEPDRCLRAHTGFVVEGTLDIDCRGSVERFETGDAHLASAVTELVRLLLFENSE